MSDILAPGVSIGPNNVVAVTTSQGTSHVYKGQVWVTSDLSDWRKVSKITEKDGIVLVWWESKDKTKDKGSLDEFFVWVLTAEVRPVMYLVVEGLNADDKSTVRPT
jgi:sucrose-6-phosphate hydrolase SacC (GH32 family)